MLLENEYRTHNCSEFGCNIIGKKVRAAGWVENIRDHGGVIFIDLRDHYGVLQVVIHDETQLEGICRETVISVGGEIRKRDEETINTKIATGEVELVCDSLVVLGKCKHELPFEVPTSTSVKEELRLKYRFLDLRNSKVHKNIVMRSEMISFVRNKMIDLGFLEIQTPILSASSPEGARDYLIPSRKHQGKFYALPQAPQIFKQLLMTSGFDKYFQIAPCFRDEDARADRSPGEFYQLDFEMAFATQEDVFRVAEEVLVETFEKFSTCEVTPAPFPRFTFDEAMLKFGTDKPDLRNPLEIIDISDMFVKSDFKPFEGKCVRAIKVPGCAKQSKSFFEKMLKFATSIGMKGLGYFKVDENLKFNGPIDKFLNDDQRQNLINRAGLEPDCVLYFIADSKKNAPVFAGQIRTEVANRMNLIEKDKFKFCFIVDFPMYDLDEETGNVIFTHNPFSMPQGGLEVLNTKDPLDILAWQYDIVCNGVELSSGAVRNHDFEALVRAFEIAGYDKQTVLDKFPALCSAFQYGAPPHAGMAPGIDRMLMLLCDEENIREVVAFPMNSNAQDLLLGAPNFVSEQQLREAHVKLR